MNNNLKNPENDPRNPAFNYRNSTMDEVENSTIFNTYLKTKKFGDYWIVKNSWGTVRGDRGYLYIRMIDDKIIKEIEGKISTEDFNELYYDNFMEHSIVCFNADKK